MTSDRASRRRRRLAGGPRTPSGGGRRLETTALSFAGAGTPLDELGLAAATERLGVHAAEIWAVLTVETRSFGFLRDRRPSMLFERHIFSRETSGRFDTAAPDISNVHPGGYGELGAPQYARLDRAIDLDRRAALRSASWGIGQVMGFNAVGAGFADVEDMVAKSMASESAQLAGMARWILTAELHVALRAHDWADFARGYNGPDYARNRYDIRLAAAFAKLIAGPLPDLSVRAAQTYLTYLGHDPGPIDGILGRFTRSALSQYQEQAGLPVSDAIDSILLSALESAVLSR